MAELSQRDPGANAELECKAEKPRTIINTVQPKAQNNHARLYTDKNSKQVFKKKVNERKGQTSPAGLQTILAHSAHRPVEPTERLM